MDEMEPRRRHKRFPVSYDVAASRVDKPLDPDARYRFPARVIDISQSGARLELRELVHPKERLNIVLSKSSVGFGLDVTGIVRWSEKITGGYHVGIEFTAIRRFSLAESAQQGRPPSAPTPPPPQSVL